MNLGDSGNLSLEIWCSLLSNPTVGGSECITMVTLQPVIQQILVANPQLLSGTSVGEVDTSTLERIATVLSQRIMHFCCRGGVRRMTRSDYESSDLGEVLVILSEGGDTSPASLEKISAFFAIEEADQVKQTCPCTCD